MRKLVKSVVILFILALVIQPAYSAQQPKVVSHDTYFGLYLLGNRIGRLHLVVKPDKYRGKDGYRMTESAEVNYRTPGRSVKSTYVTSTYLSKALCPIYQIYTLKKSGQVSVTEIWYGAQTALCKVSSGGEITTRRLTIPNRTQFIAHYECDLGARKLKPGQKIAAVEFVPTDLQFRRITTECAGQEQIEVGGKTYNALKIIDHDIKSDRTLWRLDNGDLIKISIIDGFIATRETPRSNSAGNLLEFGKIITIGTLSDPSHVRNLHLRITGLHAAGSLVNNARQHCKWDSANKSIDCSLTTTQYAQSDDSASAPEAAKYLQDSRGIEASDKAIIELSEKIIGDDKSKSARAAKLCNWVHNNIRISDAASREVLSAVHVLRAKRGVCRHMAVLYAALARAAGIPTRLVGGYVYSRNGFDHHMWAESYLGEWVPFDPTAPQNAADALHVSVNAGNLEDIENSAALVLANTRIEIINYELDGSRTNGGVLPRDH